MLTYTLMVLLYVVTPGGQTAAAQTSYADYSTQAACIAAGNGITAGNGNVAYACVQTASIGNIH